MCVYIWIWNDMDMDTMCPIFYEPYCHFTGQAEQRCSTGSSSKLATVVANQGRYPEAVGSIGTVEGPRKWMVASSSCVYIYILVGGWATPLKNRSASIGMISNPIDGKIQFMATKPPTRCKYVRYLSISMEVIW